MTQDESRESTIGSMNSKMLPNKNCRYLKYWLWLKWKHKWFSKMKATIQTFQSRQGDCIFFSIENDEKRFVTMIDCGKYTDDIREYVEVTAEKHINLLVVTHIDNDHVDGLVEMLEQTPDVRIDKILYNCNQLWNGQPKIQPSDAMKQSLQTLSTNLPSRQKNDNGKIKADKAVMLAEEIGRNDAWWEAWKKDEYITAAIKPILLDEHDKKFGKFVVLSPTVAGIERLNKNFKLEYARLTKHILAEGGNVEGQETLFELVERLASMKRRNYGIMEPVKSGAVTNFFEENKLKGAFDFEPQGVSDENEASIALMWEYDGKRVLFMGDAEPDDVADRIKAVYGDDKLEVEAVKVSHHGSKHSTSKKLLNQVDSGHYFFTGGNLKDKPSLQAIMKIVKRNDERRRTLHFNNRENKVVKALMSELGTAVREKYHFDISESNEHKFEY